MADQKKTYSIEAKSGLKKGIFPESFLVSLYRCLTPYRGCGSGCSYCDGRAEKYYIDGDFENDIGIRHNLLEILKKQVSGFYTGKEYGAIALGSGVTDIYQNIESDLKLTRQVLEILKDTGLPIVILTKSDLVLRDFDILKDFSKVLLITTITTLDPYIKKMLEPGASEIEDRLGIIERSRSAGFYTGVMAMPLCPDLSDKSEDLRKLFIKIKKKGADFIFPGGLTLRPGRQKDLFMEIIKKEKDPALLKKYEDIYRENRASGNPDRNYIVPVYASWQKILRELNIPSMIPYYIYSDLLSPIDSIYILLDHMQTLYSERGYNIYPLKKARERYGLWLADLRKKLRRKRIYSKILNSFPVTSALHHELKRTDLYELLGNKKLTRFLMTIQEEGMDFDYVNLQIRRIME